MTARNLTDNWTLLDEAFKLSPWMGVPGSGNLQFLESLICDPEYRMLDIEEQRLAFGGCLSGISGIELGQAIELIQRREEQDNGGS